MNPKRVLVAFSSRSGSTAAAAGEISEVLRDAGLLVECRPKEEVTDMSPYGAVVDGSGLFVASRSSDGGGFLERHRDGLRGRDLWLFSTGPIGGRAGRGSGADGEVPVAVVARAVGARGVATFGTVDMPDGADPLSSLMQADRREVRSWAAEIAADLGAGTRLPAPSRARRHRAVAAG